MATKDDGSKLLGNGGAKNAADEIKKHKKRRTSRLSIIMEDLKNSRKKN